MLSADEKRQQERARARRFAGRTIGVSLLLHGVLWALSPLIPAPAAKHEATFEVALLSVIPQPTKAPRPVAAKAQDTPARKLGRKRVTKRIALQEKPRPIRRKAARTQQRTLPETVSKGAILLQNKPGSKSAPRPDWHGNATPLTTALPNPLRYNNRRDSLRSPGGALQRNSTPSRVLDGGNIPFPSTPERNNEFAALPQSSGPQTGAGTNRKVRGARKSGSDFEVSLPNDSTSGPSEPTGSNNHPRPTGLGNDNSRPHSSDAASSGPRASRQSLGGTSSTYIQPGAPHPTSKGEEANDDTPNSKSEAQRRTRLTRRPSDDPTLFPTPTPRPEPKENPKPPEPEAKEEPERELLRPAKVRSSPKPPYPSNAKANNQEGTVVLRLQISEEGRVTDASIVSSSGVSSLDEASLRGVRRWTYEPARRAKTPVPSSLTARLRWRLTD